MAAAAPVLGGLSSNGIASPPAAPGAPRLFELGTVTYRSRSKAIQCFAARYRGGDDDIRLDWENDRYGWFTPEEAREVIKEEFAPLLEGLNIQG